MPPLDAQVDALKRQTLEVGATAGDVGVQAFQAAKASVNEGRHTALDRLQAGAARINAGDAMSELSKIVSPAADRNIAAIEQRQSAITGQIGQRATNVNTYLDSIRGVSGLVDAEAKLEGEGGGGRRGGRGGGGGYGGGGGGGGGGSPTNQWWYVPWKHGEEAQAPGGLREWAGGSTDDDIKAAMRGSGRELRTDSRVGRYPTWYRRQVAATTHGVPQRIATGFAKPTKAYNELEKAADYAFRRGLTPKQFQGVARSMARNLDVKTGKPLEEPRTVFLGNQAAGVRLITDNYTRAYNDAQSQMRREKKLKDEQKRQKKLAQQRRLNAVGVGRFARR